MVCKLPFPRSQQCSGHCHLLFRCGSRGSACLTRPRSQTSPWQGRDSNTCVLWVARFLMAFFTSPLLSLLQFPLLSSSSSSSLLSFLHLLSIPPLPLSRRFSLLQTRLRSELMGTLPHPLVHRPGDRGHATWLVPRPLPSLSPPGHVGGHGRPRGVMDFLSHPDFIT